MEELLPAAVLVMMTALAAFAALTWIPQARVPWFLFYGSIYFNIFQAGLMPKVHRALGGGAPQLVQFILKLGDQGQALPSPLNADTISEWPQTIEPKKLPSAKLSSKYDLIFESESDYFVSLAAEGLEHTLTVPRDSVAGVVYLTPYHEAIPPP
jgi:hypothetical protein